MADPSRCDDPDIECSLSPFADTKTLSDTDYPNCQNISAALLGWRFVPVSHTAPPLAEYVHVPISLDFGDKASHELSSFTALWNSAWEAGPLRNTLLPDKDIPEKLRWLRKHPEVNFRLVPVASNNPYVAYEPLFHLLTLKTLSQCRLPALEKGFWPPMGSSMQHHLMDHFPADFKSRLELGFAKQLWPHLNYGPRTAYSDKEPLVLLSNSLDFWLPYLDVVAQDRLGGFQRVGHDNESRQAWSSVPKQHRRELRRPRKGGDIWTGHDEAHEVMADMVEVADSRGRLRAIIEATRSCRIEDDFSPRWSYAREDFERRLYHKRLKTKVSFVELDDTIPVHCPNAEPDGDLIWQDLLTLCNPRERQVVVCLRNGVSRATEISEALGYANHSPVSKSLATIRNKVIELFKQS